MDPSIGSRGSRRFLYLTFEQRNSSRVPNEGGFLQDQVPQGNYIALVAVGEQNNLPWMKKSVVIIRWSEGERRRNFDFIRSTLHKDETPIQHLWAFVIVVLKTGFLFIVVRRSFAGQMLMPKEQWRNKDEKFKAHNGSRFYFRPRHSCRVLFYNSFDVATRNLFSNHCTETT